MNAGENNDLKEGMKKTEEDDQYFLIPPHFKSFSSPSSIFSSPPAISSPLSTSSPRPPSPSPPHPLSHFQTITLFCSAEARPYILKAG